MDLNRVRRDLHDPQSECLKASTIKKELEAKEMQPCTFRPKIGSLSHKMVEGLKPWEERQSEFAKRKSEAIEEIKRNLENKDKKECSFKPIINPRPVTAEVVPKRERKENFPTHNFKP